MQVSVALHSELQPSTGKQLLLAKILPDEGHHRVIFSKGADPC